MSKPKFTPGPWQVALYRNPETGERALAVWPKDVPLFGRGNPICLVSPENKVDDQDKINARLIAAAPELFEACEVALKAYSPDEVSFNELEEAAGILRAALAKAGGTS